MFKNLEEIEIPEITNENKLLLDDLTQLSFYELKELKKIHKKFKKVSEEEIDFKKYQGALDVLDKTEIEKYYKKSAQLYLLIDEACKRKYLEIFNKIQ